METEKLEIKDIDAQYDEISKTELEKRLKRPATRAEVANADTDSDLVNEVFWQLIKEINGELKRISAIVDKLQSGDKNGVV